MEKVILTVHADVHMTDNRKARAAKRAKFGKNPSVDTTFLPDREREEKERLVREELRQQYLRDQEETKKQDIDIVCSYWDGSGHRTVVTVRGNHTAAVHTLTSRYPVVQEGRFDSGFPGQG